MPEPDFTLSEQMLKSSRAFNQHQAIERRWRILLWLATLLLAAVIIQWTMYPAKPEDPYHGFNAPVALGMLYLLFLSNKALFFYQIKRLALLNCAIDAGLGKPDARAKFQELERLKFSPFKDVTRLYPEVP